MATLAVAPVPAFTLKDQRFFARLILAMALVVVAGFALNFLLGRSTLNSPIRVHFHAVAFMGWVGLFLAQTRFATSGRLDLHRRLGWIALAWVGLMTVTAMWVIVAMARNGTMPFFFVPQQLLVGDPLTLAGFILLTAAAIVLRRNTAWHARLHISAMAALMGPAFGRLLPMPLLMPYALEAANLAPLLFLIIGASVDLRRRGSVHPAWLCGAAALVAIVIVTDAVTYSTLGDTIYRATVDGSPGQSVPGREFPQPPASGPLTGRS